MKKNEETIYTVDYFIEKFSNIPEELWNSDGQYVSDSNPDCKCALGHCGFVSRHTDESDSLVRLFRSNDFGVVFVNDGNGEEIKTKYGNSPKERILNALKEIKEKADVK